MKIVIPSLLLAALVLSGAGCEVLNSADSGQGPNGNARSLVTRRLALGTYHTCELRPGATPGSNEVFCWGDNSSRQLGVESGANRCSPIPGLTDVVELSASYSSTCARRSNGTVACWGLGSATPVTVDGLTDAVEIAAGWSHTCARRMGGAVVCWGNNRNGQLGTGMADDGSETPVAVAGITDTVEIGAGRFFACARRSSGAVVCWGAGYSGQLGTNMPNGESATPVTVAGITDAVEIAIGDDHACARRRSGAVVCWGNNGSGELGAGMPGGVSAMTVTVTGITDAVEITAGYDHTCARRSSGAVVCWGGNSRGELGSGRAGAGGATPVMVAGITDAVEIAAGWFHTCARRRSGPTVCWGSNRSGQVGVAERGIRPTPTVPTCAAPCAMGRTVCDLSCVDTQTDAAHCGGCNRPCESGQQCAMGMCRAATSCAAGRTVCAGACVDLQTSAAHCGMCDRGCAAGETCSAGACIRAGASTVAAGGAHTCAIVNGAALCWGSNDFGQLGDGSTIPRSTCVVAANLTDAVEITAGDGHTCARRSGGAIVCWGRNDHGQLGTGMVGGDSATPVMVAGITDAVEITAGAGHTCARRSSGAVLCWGSNEYGRLGTGMAGGDSATPVMVAGITDAVEITAGEGHTCARRSGGAILCWGINGNGLLGTGMEGGNSATPVMVSGITDAVEIAAGSYHTCARRSSGAVLCWGNNFAGGLGTSMAGGSSATPVMVAGLTDAVELTAGEGHTCARRSGGAIVCWGSNDRGQLGTGMEGGNSATPEMVSGLADAVEIAAGSYHTCARRSSGAILCWGNNSSRELGDGTNERRASPVAVTCFAGCATGQTACASGCADLQTDAANCGACGTACGMGGTCRMGACMSTRMMCPAGQTDCTPTAPAPTCVDTATNAANCGACGTACNAPPAATCNGTSARTFAATGTCSASRCTYAPTDTACPARANATTTCTGAGVCGFTCSAGFADCDGAPANGCEVNLNTDRAHCGACGAACPSGQGCAAGLCRIACDAPRTVCGAGGAQSCVDVTSDSSHCGACGAACTPGQVCAGSACTTACDAPRTLCAEACVDTRTDRAHCGACGMACAAGQSCVAGVCVGQGELRVTLTWDRDGDMDLHVVPPCGTEIFFGNPMACGGELDVDDTLRRGPENVFWRATPPAGRYLFCPEAFNGSVVGATWTLTVVRGGATILTRTGVRDAVDGNTPCSASFPGVVTLDL